MHRFASITAALALATTAAAQLTVVVPAGLATAEGNSFNTLPWGRGGGGLREQCVYDSSHFTTQGITTPILITGIKWRPNTNVALVASSYTAGCSVSLSTCPVDQAAVTNVFANNRGADFATVFNGVVSWGPQPAVVGPTPFGINIPFTTPFVYDPANGDLNVECDLPIQTFTGTGPSLDMHSTAALASRVYLSTGYPVGNGIVNTNHGVVIEIEYVPADSLFATFTADVTGGPSPLTVNFTDHSYSGAPGGITTWAWDFDGDNVVDSTQQSPTFTYTNCGTYTVSLTVNDGVHAPSTKTRTNYIETDHIVVGFTSQLIGPNIVQFTDTSSMPATSWAWDLDGDTVVDSTSQNPVLQYPNANPVNVTLTVTRLCSPPSTVSKQVWPIELLGTNLASSNAGASGWTVYYDLNVTNPLGVDIASIGSVTATVNAPFTIDYYLNRVGFAGSELVASQWTKVGTASGVSGPTSGQQSFASFALPLHVPQGAYGAAMRYTGIAPRYTTGASVVTNSDMWLSLGSTAATTTTPFQAVNAPANRSWAGTLYYETNDVALRAAYGWFAQGCPGTLGISSVAHTTRPVIGGTLSTTVDNLEFGMAVMVLGLSNTASGPIPLPMDLTVLGAPGCSLRVSLDATETVLGAGPSVPWSFAIPNNPSLLSAQIYSQAAPLSSTNTFGFVTSHAYGWVVGF